MKRKEKTEKATEKRRAIAAVLAALRAEHKRLEDAGAGRAILRPLEDKIAELYDHSVAGQVNKGRDAKRARFPQPASAGGARAVAAVAAAAAVAPPSRCGRGGRAPQARVHAPLDVEPTPSPSPTQPTPRAVWDRSRWPHCSRAPPLANDANRSPPASQQATAEGGGYGLKAKTKCMRIRREFRS